MGMHRVCRGDASDMSAVRRLFGASRATLVVTSPPYYNQRDYAHWSSYDVYLADMARVIAAITTVAAGPFACCWNVGDCVRDGLDVPADHSLIFRHLGFRYRDKIAWVKPMPVYSVQRWRHIGSARYFPALQWEPILVFTRNGHPRFERDDIPLVKRNHSNVWKIDPVPAASQKKIGHPAVFPEELVRRCVLAYSKRGDVVFDPFLGSGTTLSVCEELGRRCYGMDLSARFLKVAADRWQATRLRRREGPRAGN